MHIFLGVFRGSYVALALVAVVVLFGTTIAIAEIISGDSSTNKSNQITITQVTINKPVSAATGDVLLANITVKDGSGAAITAPPGWTEILRTDNSTFASIISYWKAAGTEEPGSYMWSIDRKTTAEGGITRYNGVDPTDPIDTAAGQSGFGKIAIAPAITTTDPNEEVVAIFSTNVGAAADAGSYFSQPLGMTEKYDVSNTPSGPSTALDDATQSSVGDSGTKSSTIAGNRKRNWAAQTIALRTNQPPPPVDISIETNAFGPTTFDQNSSSATTATFAKTNSATSTLLIVSIDSYNEPTTVTYDSAAMTKIIGNFVHSSWHTIWKLDKPPSGTHVVEINFSGQERSMGTAVSFTGTNTASSTGASAVSFSTSGNPSLSITTINSGSIIYDDLFYNFNQTITPNSPQVKLSEIQESGGTQTTSGVSALRSSATGLYSLGWTHGGPSDMWIETALEINRAP